MLPIGSCAQTACVWEATARKPGNVHRYRDFADTTYLDFLLSAAAVAPVLEGAPHRRVGATVLEAVRATRQVVARNTNLGIVLLLAPLAAVGPHRDLRVGTAAVLDALGIDDSHAVFEAIRLATPGGLGRSSEQDVAEEPTLPLRQIMALASDRDLLARQYANGFREVLDDGVPALAEGLEQTRCLEDAIIFCHLHLLATCPDSLIARKCGLPVADEASRRAQRVLASDWTHDRVRLRELDDWLRSDGNRRNPGTTADLVTACLFVALRRGTIQVPLQLPWGSGADHVC